MNAALVAVIVSVALIGIVLLIAGLIPADRSNPDKVPSRRSLQLQTLRSKFTRRQRYAVVAGLVGGVVVWLLSGWVIALIAVPAAVIGVPFLTSGGNEKATIDKLEGLQNWIRALAGLITAGSPLESAIGRSASSAADSVKEQVADLAARLNARWPTDDALMRFAHELADPTADMMIAHLRLAAKERGPGLATALEDIAQDVFDEVKARRQIEADRAKPRQNIRFITYITFGILLLIPFAGQFFAAYSSPIGQLILAVLIAALVAVLIWLKQMTTGKPTPRILVTVQEGK